MAENKEVFANNNSNNNPSFSYEEDFCFKIALIAAEEYAPASRIKKIIKQLIDEIRVVNSRKKVLLSLTLKFYNEVYKNSIFTKQLRTVFDTYQNVASKLGYDNPRVIEKHCVDTIKLPAMQDLISHVCTELIKIFERIEDSEFVDLVSFYLHGNFISSVRSSVVILMRSPEIMCGGGDDRAQQEITKVAQLIMFAIESIKNALGIVCEKRSYSIVSNKIKSSKTQLQRQSNPKSENERIDRFLKEYLQEILQDKIKSETQTQTENNLVKDQLIRIPELIKAMKGILDNENKEPAIPPSPTLKRNALSIVSHIKKATEDSEDFEEIPLNAVTRTLVLKIRGKNSCCGFTGAEEFSALFDRFPLVEYINDAMSMRTACFKFLRLYPAEYTRLGPFVIGIELGMGLLGVLVATDAILHPKQHRTFTRLWRSVTHGTVCFIFTLGASINIFLWDNPDVKDISNEKFYRDIAAVPIAFSSLYVIWYCISPHTKEKYFPRGTCYYPLRLSTDTILNSGRYAGIVLVSLIMVVNLPKTLPAQVLPIVPGFILALTQALSPIKDRLNTLMTYLTCSVSFGSFIQLCLNPNHEIESTWHFLARTLLLSGVGVYSIYLLRKNYKQFLHNYISEDDMAACMIVRRVQVPIQDNGTLDTSAFLGQGLLVDATDNRYKQLTDEIEGGQEADPTPRLLMLSEQAKIFEKSKRLEAVTATIESTEIPRRSSFCDNCVVM